LSEPLKLQRFSEFARDRITGRYQSVVLFQPVPDFLNQGILSIT
jgi:hypothetical protein